MFNKNFYPTPERALCLLFEGFDFRGNLKILEPSAGKGDIIDYVEEHRYSFNDNKVRIDAIEKQPELQSILYGKRCHVVGSDFLTYETNTEYHQIVMNPPFDEGVKHLLKAIQLAENQTTNACQVRCILNAETIKNPYTNERKLLLHKLQNYKTKYTYYNNLFMDSERKTNVEVAIIIVDIPAKANEYTGIFNRILNDIPDNKEKSYMLSTVLHTFEIEKRVKEIELYVRLYNQHIEYLKKMYRYISLFEGYELLVREEGIRTYTANVRGSFDNINEAVEELRKKYWEKILNTEEFSKVLTANAKTELYKKVEQASNLEITIENIQMLLIALYQNRKESLKTSIVDFFEQLTANHMEDFSKNIHYYNGWKTNNAFKIKKKVIIRSHYSEHDMWRAWHGRWNTFENGGKTREVVLDLIKSLQLLSDEKVSTEFQEDGNGGYENDILFIKCYKKGTTHITFKNLDLLDAFNIFVGQQKNWLPTNSEYKNDEQAKTHMDTIFENYKLCTNALDDIK